MGNIQQVAPKHFFNNPAVQKAFDDVLKGSGKEFTTSMLSLVQSNRLLQKTSNESLYAAAMKAAVLQLPIEPSLGYAYIVPYKGQAQFQLGYKGLIQLAQRSGLYKSINSGVVYKSQLVKYDPLFEELVLDFTQPQDEIVGYFAAFRLLNGFEKISYWTKEEATAHGKRFSKSFNNGPWQSDFDAMAQKTVLKSILSKYGPLSVEMQKAIKDDNEDSIVGDSDPKDVTPDDNQESIDDFMGKPVEIEQTRESTSESEVAEQAQSEVAEDTSYPAEDIPSYEDQPLEEQGALFDNLSEVM